MARPGASPEVRQRAAERQRRMLQLRIRTLPFDAIDNQIGAAKSSTMGADRAKSSSNREQFEQMTRGGNRLSREAILAAHERERQCVQLFIRGLSWLEIGRQLGISDVGARKAFDRAVKRIPPKDAELLRKLQSDRLCRLSTSAIL
jgi:DNA-directed RNA polymerase specialized sigma subunit